MQGDGENSEVLGYEENFNQELGYEEDFSQGIEGVKSWMTERGIETGRKRLERKAGVMVSWNIKKFKNISWKQKFKRIWDMAHCKDGLPHLGNIPITPWTLH